MPTSEIVSILTALTGIAAIIVAFLPKLWEKRKVFAEAKTEGANENKVRAEAATILVDTTLTLAARLDDQILALIGERDILKKERDAMKAEYDGKFMQIYSDMAKAQQELAMVLSQFDECKKKLELLYSRANLSAPAPFEHKEIN